MLLQLVLVACAEPSLVPRDAQTDWIHGRVVAEADGAAIAGARASACGFAVDAAVATTAADGSFALEGRPCCSPAADSSLGPGIDYLRVTAPGAGVALVDPCSNAPWAMPIRLRPGATLGGRIRGAPPGSSVFVTAPADELCWPPRSGLTCAEKALYSRLGDDGRFEFDDLPAQVLLDVVVDLGASSRVARAVPDVVLKPGERRELDLEVSKLPRWTPPPSDVELEPAGRIPLVARIMDEKDVARPLGWLERFDGVQPVLHRVAGGRAHVHRHRACDHFDAEPGLRTLIARDVDGGIGVRRVEITPGASEPVTLVVAPGALLRLDASALGSHTRVRFGAAGVELFARELVPGVVRYEVLPAGDVELRLESRGRPTRERTCSLRAGEVTSITL